MEGWGGGWGLDKLQCTFVSANNFNIDYHAYFFLTFKDGYFKVGEGKVQGQ